MTRRAWGAGLLFLCACAAVWAWGNLPAAYEGAKAARLRLSGVRRVDSGGLVGWVRDGCEPGKPCACVAFVHGMGDSATTWTSLLARGRNGERLYAFNMPGTDGSAAPADPSGYRIRAQAKTLRGALEPLCPRWTLVGNSLGGWISGWLALDWPQGVERLVLVGAAGVDDPSGSAESAARVLADPTPATVRAFMEKTDCRPPRLPEHALEGIARTIASRPTKAILSQLSRDELFDREIRSLRMPVEIVWGACDRVLPVSMGDSFHRLIPGSRYTVLPDCGHIPQRECPAALRRALFPS